MQETIEPTQKAAEVFLIETPDRCIMQWRVLDRNGSPLRKGRHIPASLCALEAPVH